jgi:hypothetical protein
MDKPRGQAGHAHHCNGHEQRTLFPEAVAHPVPGDRNTSGAPRQQRTGYRIMG